MRTSDDHLKFEKGGVQSENNLNKRDAGTVRDDEARGFVYMCQCLTHSQSYAVA